jgi:hypothetical protein
MKLLPPVLHSVDRIRFCELLEPIDALRGKWFDNKRNAALDYALTIKVRPITAL